MKKHNSYETSDLKNRKKIVLHI